MSIEWNPECQFAQTHLTLHIDADPHSTDPEYKMVLLQAYSTYYADDKVWLDKSRRNLMCRRLLLTADADPTVAPGENSSHTPIVEALDPRFVPWDHHNESVQADHDCTVSF